MKKLVIALLTLPFVFSCNGSGEYPDKKGDHDNGSSRYLVKEGIVRVEIEHGEFSGDLNQKLPVITLNRWNSSMKNLKIKGTDQSFEMKGKELVSHSYYHTVFVATDKKLSKKLVYETSGKVDNFMLGYYIGYDTDRRSNIDQDIPIKVRLYVDGKLKREESSVYKLKEDYISSRAMFFLVYNSTSDYFQFNTTYNNGVE